ncbi:MAG: hypothetical protein IJ934_03780 [Acetobacter sp.]|nr:hypothetical protein [Acetobacter sp.]
MKKGRFAGVSDMLFITGLAAFVMLVWSLLARHWSTSFAGFAITLWFPLSILLYRGILRWFDVLVGESRRSLDLSSHLRRQVTAACLLTASFSVVFLTCFSISEALERSFALNVVCLLALLDTAERRMPSLITVPLLLYGLWVGLMAGTLEQAGQAVFGACVVWIGVSIGLGILSISLRRRFLSGEVTTMAAACGAWVGLSGIGLFLGSAACIYWCECMVVQYGYGYFLGRFGGWEIPLEENEGKKWKKESIQPMGPSLALGLGISFLFKGLLPDGFFSNGIPFIGGGN